ncbi:MAG: hypothetical protein LQ340_006542 [Diploschistes diacapsis]|nr:MAG: hypothetical protein LQ340_006542 [Diploschistes diacapsis]
MVDSQASTASILSGGGDPSLLHSSEYAKDLDLSGYPHFFVLRKSSGGSTTNQELTAIQLELKAKGATLANGVHDAQLILATDVNKPLRAEFELRNRKVKLEPWVAVKDEQSNVKSPSPSSRKRKHSRGTGSSSARKTRRISIGSKTKSDTDASDRESHFSSDTSLTLETERDILVLKHDRRLQLSRFRDPLFVKVVKLAWLRESVKQLEPQPLEQYTLYEGTKILIPNEWAKSSSSFPTTSSSSTFMEQSRLQQVPAQNTAEAATPEPENKSSMLVKTQPNSLQTTSPQYTSRNLSFRRKSKKPALLRETTSEHENTNLVETPQWVRDNKIYACERITLQQSQNKHFLNQLRTIKHGRDLIGDQTGIRAYSTIIASVAAYPYPLRSAKEVAALPGCDEKAVRLFREFQTEGCLKEAHEVKTDEAMKVKDLFWNIYGVGPNTARRFYNNGWKDLDDVTEYGWESLNFEQKIGLKYYHEFLSKIPRPESERIASIVAEHAKKLIGDEIQYTIVGGYRRGKPESGDVDIVLSHPVEKKTLNLITPLVAELARSGWITHELELFTSNSKRDQRSIPANIRREKTGGFDTLDKALVVWQDPSWPTKEQDLAADPKAKNPNVHRRVDIIISPWRTVGCAVMGWTSGTTFQRDIRRYVKHTKKWKFDSSGVTDRLSGNWLDLERWADPNERATTIEEAERRVFEGMGLEYREPWERCTD